MADWGARTVAVDGKAASAHLSHNTLSGGRWMLVDEEGTILQSDDTTVRQAVTLRVARAVATARLTPADPGRGRPARLNQDSLWLSASTAATTIPGTREALSKHCVTMMYGALYNAEQIARTPQLAGVTLATPRGSAPLSQCCPLCQPTADSQTDLPPTAPGPDTKAHLFHACPHTCPERDNLHAALTAAAQAAGAGPASATKVADAIVARPDYYAGQIDASARQMLRDCLSAQASHVQGAGPKTPLELLGRTLQRLTLENSKSIHDRRAEAVALAEARAAAAGLTSEHDVMAYKKALWAEQQHAATSAEAEQRREARKAKAALKGSHKGRLPPPPPRAGAPGPARAGRRRGSGA